MTSFDFETMESEDYLDVRDIIARFEELESELGQIHFDQGGEAEFADWIEAEWNCEEFGFDEVQEFRALQSLLDDMKGRGGDEQWRSDWYPVTLIRDSYFTEYTQELIEDCGYISKDFPSWIEVDWEATAHNVRIDFSATEIKGVTYWYR